MTMLCDINEYDTTFLQTVSLSDVEFRFVRGF